MYLLVDPLVIGNVKCDVTRDKNPAGLKIQEPYYKYLAKEEGNLTCCLLISCI